MIVPFFVTYLIRTLSWQTILDDESVVVDVLKFVGVLGDDGRVLATTGARDRGHHLQLPAVHDPAALREPRADRPRMLEAGYDLYGTRRAVFTRVTLPLSAPGVVAGVLLTFIPAAGDFINAELLGTPRQAMIGNVIQSRYLEVTDYPTAAALSFILMAADPRAGAGLGADRGHRVADGGGGALMEAATASADGAPDGTDARARSAASCSTSA